MGKTSSAVKQKYNEKAYDQIKVTVPKGKRAEIQKWAQERGETVNGFVNEAFRVGMGLSVEEWKRSPAASDPEQASASPLEKEEGGLHG